MTMTLTPASWWQVRWKSLASVEGGFPWLKKRKEEEHHAQNDSAQDTKGLRYGVRVVSVVMAHWNDLEWNQTSKATAHKDCSNGDVS